MSIIWNVLGHENIIQYLEKCVIQNSYHHAYIFLGPENIGKETVAKKFSKIALCEKKQSDAPCEKCESCLQFNKFLHPDFYEVKREKNEKTKSLNKNISIEQILRLQNSINKYSLFKNHTVIVIDQADTLSEKAKNALLKTLEEPNPHTIIILILNDVHNLPKTILSRCQIIKFYPVAYDTLYNYLLNKGHQRNSANILAKISYGMPGKAILFGKNKEKLEEYISFGKIFIDFTKLPLIQKLKKLSSLVDFKENEYSESIQKLYTIFNIWMLIIRDVLLLHYNNSYLIGNIFAENDLAELSKNKPLRYWQDAYVDIINAKKLLKNNVHPKIVLENFIINL